MQTSTLSHPRQLLRMMLGPDATFRPGQLEAIEALVLERKRVLLVQRTGWGKSLVYFLATRLLRERGAGPTLLISPLLALMRNQIAAAERIGLRAVTLNSANRRDWEAIEADLRADTVDVLLVSPERLVSERFWRETLPGMPRGIGLLAVDEAHCISDWGHDFRTDYRQIVRVVRQLPPDAPVLCTTATANDRVIRDIREQLGWDLEIQRGPLMRETLRLQTITLAHQVERLAWLAQYLSWLPGTGIMYCLTTDDCEHVSAWLRQKDIDAPAYHAGLLPAQRVELEQRLLANDVKALVATVALGMGFDKPDLGFVVHYQRPGSMVAYYQQVGRAGRAGDGACGILLHGREDDAIQEHFINHAFPTAEEHQQVLGIIEHAGMLNVPGLLARTTMSWERLEHILDTLERADAIARMGNIYLRTPNRWRPDERRAREVTANRRRELERMRAFVRHPGCLMEFMARELDDPYARPCGRCSNCVGDVVSRSPNMDMVQEAAAFLGGGHRVIAPRRQWPVAGVRERWDDIPTWLQVTEGRALGVYGDAVWGGLVRRGKDIDGRFDDQLVWVAAYLIGWTWRPQPAPAWVTTVPAPRAELVEDFARRLADALSLPFYRTLVKVRDTPMPQTLPNDVQHAQQVAGALATAGPCPPEPVLLVADVVASRWTQTACGILLRRAGSGPVYPFALAIVQRAGNVLHAGETPVSPG
jgi:ATP-dependent DNA helicase RecQ